MKRTVVLTVIILLAAGFMMQSQAQVKQVELRVDGLACPFCAYGLEKKLKQIDGVGKIQINVDKAVVVLENDAGQSVAVEKLESTVTEAGFTPREITATVVGKVSRKDGSPFFSVTGTDVAFILKNNEELKKLQSKLNGTEKTVRVTGHLNKETPAGHHAHPYTLSIENFEVVK